MSNFSDLKTNQGMVIQENDQKIAIYKDKDGKTHKLSATCTHKGCTVNWDDQKKEWSCPCHGATYSPEGFVTGGPAQKDLTPIE